MGINTVSTVSTASAVGNSKFKLDEVVFYLNQESLNHFNFDITKPLDQAIKPINDIVLEIEQFYLEHQLDDEPRWNTSRSMLRNKILRFLYNNNMPESFVIELGKYGKVISKVIEVRR